MNTCRVSAHHKYYIHDLLYFHSPVQQVSLAAQIHDSLTALTSAPKFSIDLFAKTIDIFTPGDSLSTNS